MTSGLARRIVAHTELNGRMEFDCPIRVHADGTVSHASGPCFKLNDGELSAPAGWSLMTGYTGQYGYRGPIMHPSEYIGGRMARDILATPGLYVALVDYPTGCADECVAGDDECQCGDEPDGWAVAYLPDEDCGNDTCPTCVA